MEQQFWALAAVSVLGLVIAITAIFVLIPSRTLLWRAYLNKARLLDALVGNQTRLTGVVERNSVSVQDSLDKMEGKLDKITLQQQEILLHLRKRNTTGAGSAGCSAGSPLSTREGDPNER